MHPDEASLVGLNGYPPHSWGAAIEVMLTNAAWPFISLWLSNYIPDRFRLPLPQQLFQTCMWLNLLPLLPPSSHSQQVTEEQEALVKGECPQH